jgi:hypothetical protein
VSCPLDCEYLRDSRRHEKPVLSQPVNQPDQDIRVTDNFLRDHDDLLMSLAGIIAEAALAIPGVVDWDVRDALAALVRTYRTLASGMYYETRPDNALAARLCATVQEKIQSLRAEEQQLFAMPRTRDSDILQCLVFFERVEFDHDNGRRRGRAFIDLLSNLVRSPERASAPGDSLLLLP